MPVEYDFQKYKPLIREYVRALRPGCDSGGNFQCLNPDHDDGTMPSQWSMCWGKQPNTLHCYGCGTGGHDWDIYDLVGALEGITGKGDQYKRVAEIAGDVVGSAEKWVCPPSTAPEPEFVPDPEAIEAVYGWLKGVRPSYVDRIDAFSSFRGHSSEWGRRLAWWPGLEVARGALSEDVLIAAGLVDPSKPTAAWNASGAVVRIGRGFKLHYAGRPEEDGHVPTIKRGSRGCHTFPFPALPDGDTVVLVEGELDAVSGRMAGIPAVSTGGTNGMTAEDAKKLSGYRVILALDNDDPGRKATQKLSHYFPSRLSVDWSRINLQRYPFKALSFIDEFGIFSLYIQAVGEDYCGFICFFMLIPDHATYTVVSFLDDISPNKCSDRHTAGRIKSIDSTRNGKPAIGKKLVIIVRAHFWALLA